MKSTPFFLAVLFSFLAISLSAQLSINPKVGINVSNLDTKLNDLRTEARVGWNAGADLRFGDGMFFFSPGLHYYAFTTETVRDINEDTRIENKSTLQSLRAPLNIGLNLLGSDGALGLYAKGGVTGAYVLGISDAGSGSYTLDDLNRTTWAYNVGAGINLLFLTAELNYEVGQRDFFKNATGSNNVLTLSAGIKF